VQHTRIYKFIVYTLLTFCVTVGYYQIKRHLDIGGRNLEWDALLTLFFMFLIFSRGNLVQKRISTTKGAITSFLLLNIITGLFLSLSSLYIHKLSNDSLYLDWYYQYFKVRIFLIGITSNLLAVLHYTFKSAELQTAESEPQIIYESNNKDAELYKLRQQINPHFLFNALNSINALIQFDKEKARNMIVNLSQYYRNTININEQEWHTIEQELDDIILYFNIEKIRFGHRLQLEISCPDELKQYSVPPLLYQPLVENAIKHGLYGTIGEIRIIISVYITRSSSGKQFITFQIDNPFDHTTATKAQGTGFGLDNIKRRMYLLFATHNLFRTHVRQTDEQTSTFKAFLSIPLTATKN